MKKFAILADTSHNFDLKTAEKYDIYLLKYYLTLGDKTYQDLTEIETRHFYKVMKDYDELYTAVPGPEDAQKMIDQIRKDGYKDILTLTSSADVTGMYNLQELIKKENPDLNIKVLDTRSVSMGSGFQGIYAAMLRDKGMDLETVYNKLSEKIKDSYIYAIFRTLDYVVKGGRLSPIKGAIGKLFHIHPILGFEEGKIKIHELVRGEKKSFEKLLSYIKNTLNGRPYFLNIFSGDNDEEREVLKERLKNEIKNAVLYLETDITPVLGVHGGPGSIGCIIYYVD